MPLRLGITGRTRVRPRYRHVTAIGSSSLGTSSLAERFGAICREPLDGAQATHQFDATDIILEPFIVVAALQRVK